MAPTKPYEFAEVANQALYGEAVYATMGGSGVTAQSGEDIEVRSAFVANGKLTGAQDTNFRPANVRHPVAAHAIDLGAVQAKASQVLFVIGHVRDPNIQYLSVNTTNIKNNKDLVSLPTPHAAYWSAYFRSKYPNTMDALAFFYDDFKQALVTSAQMDTKVKNDATAFSKDYYNLVALSARQAWGGIEITVGKEKGGYNQDVLAWMKEISSDGNVNTVDVIMPSMPIWLYMDPPLLKYLLLPLFRYQSWGIYPHAWSMHDIGSHFPNATGHPTGTDEQMPIEESGNMIIMTLAYTQFTKDASLATTYYSLLHQWAVYLVNNTLIPGNQLATTDAAGPLANQTNLAVKGIIALSAMARLATLTNHPADAQYFQRTAESYILSWKNMSLSSDGKRILLAYQQPQSWGIQFNLYADVLLGLGLVPADVYAILDSWYISAKNSYGVQLDTRVTWGKTDWNMWCAATSRSNQTRDMFIETISQYIQSGDSQGPLPDRYDTNKGTAVGNIRARPTVGAHFSLLALHNRG